MATPVEQFAGAFIMELVLTVLLYGITTAQAHFYWWSYPDDSKLIKRTVLIVWLLETVHTAFCFHLIYNYTIIDFGQLLRLEELVWSVGATIITGVATAAIVQSFFIHRIWILSGRNVVASTVPAILLFFRVALGCATAGLTWKIGYFPEFRTSLGPRVTLTCGLSLAAIVDLVIALLLMYYLRLNQPLSERTKHILASLQAYIVNTGALTMIVSITIVLTFIFVQGSFLFFGLVQLQSKLYANSFIATLNARQRLKSTRTDPAIEAVTMSFASGAPPSLSYVAQAGSMELYESAAEVTNSDADHFRVSGGHDALLDHGYEIGIDGHKSRSSYEYGVKRGRREKELVQN